MLGQRKRVRTLEEERRARTIETVVLTVVMLITLVLIYKAMTAV